MYRPNGFLNIKMSSFCAQGVFVCYDFKNKQHSTLIP